MAALETFEWFLSSMMKNPSPEAVSAAKEARAYLLTLRSEDECQRFVAETIERIRGKNRLRS